MDECQLLTMWISCSLSIIVVINMASVAMLLDGFLLFYFISRFNADTHLPPVSPKQVDISDHWERKGSIHQDKHIKEVIVERGLDHLRLVCAIEPALPLTEEHFRRRNDLVRFEKLYPERYVVAGMRYWSDDQQKTAVALDTGSAGLFGTYICTYGHIKKTVEVLAENTDVLKDFPAPRTLEEMFSFSFVKKNVAAETSLQPVIGNKDFDCHKEISEVKPSSVHKLTPTDIDVVATLGDSIMVGLGARAESMSHFFTEYRGISWSNGGDSSIQDVVTLPNILKRFNARLRGYSKNTSRYYDKNSGLNMAAVHSTSRDLEEQVNDLIHKIKGDKAINFKDDWKLVTVMFGTRDLCRLCENKVIVSPDEYIKSLIKALDILQAELPRTFVNLIFPLNVTALDSFYRRSDCYLQNWSICPCITNNFKRQEISNFLLGYKRLVYELVSSGVYDRTDDFTVVIQPVFDNLTFGEQDRDLFSLDCLHFSAKGNALAATSLWNNMLEPVEKKQGQWSEKSIKCPSKESPYFSTRKNSESETPSKSEGVLDSHHDGGMAAGVVAALSLSILCALTFTIAFVFLKHKLKTSVRKLRFSNKPWLKYSI